MHTRVPDQREIYTSFLDRYRGFSEPRGILFYIYLTLTRLEVLSMGKSLNPKQRAFAEEYIANGGNAYKAAIAAGYAPATASRATDWITPPKDGAKRPKGRGPYRPEIREYIDEILDKIASARIADAKEVLEYLTAVMRGETRSYVLYYQEEGQGQSIMKKPPDEGQRLEAAKTLTKVLGMNNTKVDLTGVLPIVISGEDSLED